MATSNITAQPFIADAKSIDRLNGASIKWSVVTEVDDNGNKFIPAGSIMSRETGGFAPAKVATAEVCGIIETDAYADPNSNDALSGYGIIVGGVVYDNLLSDSAHANFGTWKTSLEAYGNGFTWLTYGDSRDAS